MTRSEMIDSLLFGADNVSDRQELEAMDDNELETYFYEFFA